MNTEKFEIVAKTFQGLEDVLAEELKNLGAEDIEIGRRMVSFHGDKTLLYKTNLACRTAQNQFGLSNSSENTETYL